MVPAISALGKQMKPKRSHPYLISSLLPVGLLLLCASCATPATAPTPPPQIQPAPVAVPVPPTLRLDPRVRPTRYSANLTVDPAASQFVGTIDIELTLPESTSLIWLNAGDLTVKEATLKAGERTLSARAVPGGEEFLGLATDAPMGPGPALLHIRYQGKILIKENIGLFRQKAGEDFYAFTDFEPTDARRVFPCFDEPSFKVPWQLTLHVPKGQTAFSNTPVEAESATPDGQHTFRFKPTPPLSSYLVAFAVGPFERVDAGSVGPTQVGIIVPRGRSAEARYAAESTPKILGLLNDYFGIPYPYEKLDLISVPLLGGAMENAGLVTFRETLILAAKNEETLSFQRNFAATCAHELAHQWFGDLVTMNFWNDIWLNESFASWMDEKIIDQWKPQWAQRTEAIAGRSGTMAADSLVSARRIRQPIESKDDISNAFDGITYGKGEAVLDMFESWLTPEVFRKGVQAYLKEHAFGNATADDFLRAQSAASGKDVKTPFATFLDQAGLPVVSATLRCDPGQAPVLILAQRRYLPVGSKGSAEQTWQVPVCVRHAGQPKDMKGGECTLLAGATAELRLSAKTCPAWVLPNAGEAGYYRVSYQGDLLARLLKNGAPALTPAERVGVLQDLRAQVRAGELPAAQALALAAPFARDKNRHLFGAAMSVVLGMHDIVTDEMRPGYARLVRSLFGARAKELGWRERKGESEDANLLRPQVLSAVAEYGEDRALLAEAGKLARAWLKDRGRTGTKETLDDDLVGPVLRAAARGGDRALFEAYHQAAKDTKSRRERTRLLGAMGVFHDPAILKDALPILLSGEFDMRDMQGLIYQSFDERENREQTWAFLKQNFDGLAERLPKDGAAHLPRPVGGAFCDEPHRADAETFFTGRSTRFTGGPRILAQSLERIALCTAFAEAQRKSLASYLKKP